MPDQPASDNRALVQGFIEREAESLLKTLHFYVRRSGLAQEQAVSALAAELMDEVTVEALAHAERFDPSRQARAWLLGIAANLIKRQQAQRARLLKREPLARDLQNSQGPSISEDEVFDRLAAFSPDSPEKELENEQELERMLAGLSPDDRRLIQMGVLHEMNGEELALELGVSPGAARVRLHRALGRLRSAWEAEGQTRIRPGVKREVHHHE
jgi:RNA polymerase sigma factor (sigma-70 family)